MPEVRALRSRLPNIIISGFRIQNLIKNNIESDQKYIFLSVGLWIRQNIRWFLNLEKWLLLEGLRVRLLLEGFIVLDMRGTSMYAPTVWPTTRRREAHLAHKKTPLPRTLL